MSFKAMGWLCVVLLWCADVLADTDKPVITWRAPDFPPFFAGIDGRNGGVLDRLHLLVTDAMPEYQHRYRQSDFARMIYEMERGVSTCSYALLWTPERSTFVAYSDPVIPMLPPGLVLRRDQADRLAPLYGGERRVSLTALLENESLRLGVVRGRSYGRAVDQIARQYFNRVGLNDPRTVRLRHAELLFGLLEAGRVDAILAHSSEVHYYAGSSNTDLVFLALTEQPAYLLQYYGCPRGAWGNAIIDAIDKVLEDPAIRQEGRDLYRQTLLPVDRRAYDDVFDLFMERRRALP
ncbi:TIGR02285 family protein [Marinobacter sp. JSM 1782161]|uniref:TIGR02285 family protein n=1 Tax=Marinobacter sp. JSM 1782161 TaxID=2685906 RepID=UPI0014034CBB|nr:TIGR02285 family protein [Marinobacter sp. JSM 1782161]